MEQQDGKVGEVVESEISRELLTLTVERIERREQEKADLAQDIRDIYLEAKGHGYDPKIIRKIVADRKKTQDEIDEEYAILKMYKAALGMASE
jgi:uncharacterized protein (UPF0335 family)